MPAQLTEPPKTEIVPFRTPTPMEPRRPPTAPEALEGIIVAATLGKPGAGEMLRPILRRIALSSVAHVEEADRVTEDILLSLRPGKRRIGRPRPGCAVTFLENLVRSAAKLDSFEQIFALEEIDEEEEEEPDPDG